MLWNYDCNIVKQLNQSQILDRVNDPNALKTLVLKSFSRIYQKSQMSDVYGYYIYYYYALYLHYCLNEYPSALKHYKKALKRRIDDAITFYHMSVSLDQLTKSQIRNSLKIGFTNLFKLT